LVISPHPSPSPDLRRTASINALNRANSTISSNDQPQNIDIVTKVREENMREEARKKRLENDLLELEIMKKRQELGLPIG